MRWAGDWYGDPKNKAVAEARINHLMHLPASAIVAHQYAANVLMLVRLRPPFDSVIFQWSVVSAQLIMQIAVVAV